jgi:hypothetical protein
MGPIKQIAGASCAADGARMCADDKGSVFTEEEMGVDFAGPMATSEKPESLEKGMGS